MPTSSPRLDSQSYSWSLAAFRGEPGPSISRFPDSSPKAAAGPRGPQGSPSTASDAPPKIPMQPP
eukprot:8192007-Pyramimonas_sp.AAC.1